MRPILLILFLRLITGCAADVPPAYGAMELRIVNVGTAPLDSVVVLVTGASYFIKQIQFRLALSLCNARQVRRRR